MWLNGQVACHYASPATGSDLGCSARPGDPVALFTAQQELRVDMPACTRRCPDVCMGPAALFRPGVIYFEVARTGCGELVGRLRAAASPTDPAGKLRVNGRACPGVAPSTAHDKNAPYGVCIPHVHAYRTHSLAASVVAYDVFPCSRTVRHDACWA